MKLNTDFLKPLIEFKNPVMYAIPVFIVMILIEVLISYKEKKDSYISSKDTWASLSMGIGSIFSDILAKSLAFALFYYLYDNFALFPSALSWTFFGWVLLFFLDDFIFYWHHRLSHEIRILWAAHVNHHSSEHYNLSTALRQSWTEVLYKYGFYFLLPILGFHPIMIFTQMSINLIFQFWVHTKLIKKLPWPIEFLFNTPSHHRVHHASNPIYLDRNHAGTLIIWDRLFGTFQEELDEVPVVYGITENIKTFNPFKIASLEFFHLFYDVKNAKSMIAAFQYIFYPPGWKEGKEGKTTKDLRKF